MILLLILPVLITNPIDTSKLHKLQTPKVQYRPNVATATSSPWIDANGWTILRHPNEQYLYDAPGKAAARAAAEGFAYGAKVSINTDAAGQTAFNEMLEFLKTIPQVDLPAIADIGVTDDGTDQTGELMNLLSRRNLLYKITTKPDPSLPVNAKPSKDNDPYTAAQDIRYQLTDDRRSIRIYGSEVVIARLTGDKNRARVHLLNYADRNVRGLRVRVLGSYSRADIKAFGVPNAALQDVSREDGATEFTVPELSTYAVIDLAR